MILGEHAVDKLFRPMYCLLTQWAKPDGESIVDKEILTEATNKVISQIKEEAKKCDATAYLMFEDSTKVNEFSGLFMILEEIIDLYDAHLESSELFASKIDKAKTLVKIVIDTDSAKKELKAEE